MPPVSQLLDIQELDLASDRLSERRRILPEREAILQSVARASSLDADLASLHERREALDHSEHEIADAVAAVAGKAKEVEDTLYSGTVKAPKELTALQEEIRLQRERQSGLEEQEMELLEEIDRTENEITDNRAARDRADGETGNLEAAIRQAEAAIDAELAALVEQRGADAQGVPTAVLNEYDRLRAKGKPAVRYAAALGKGSCDGCRLKLPVLEYQHMKAEPEDAVIRCVSCHRVLVR